MALFPETFLNILIIAALAGTAIGAIALLYLVAKDSKNKSIW